MKVVVDHIGIAVADLDAALAFYRDALGLEIPFSFLTLKAGFNGTPKEFAR